MSTDYSLFMFTVDLDQDAIKITCKMCPPADGGKEYGTTPRVSGRVLVAFMDEHYAFLHEGQLDTRGGTHAGLGELPIRPGQGRSAPLVHRR